MISSMASSPMRRRVPWRRAPGAARPRGALGGIGSCCSAASIAANASASAGSVSGTAAPVPAARRRDVCGRRGRRDVGGAIAAESAEARKVRRLREPARGVGCESARAGVGRCARLWESRRGAGSCDRAGGGAAMLRQALAARPADRRGRGCGDLYATADPAAASIGGAGNPHGSAAGVRRGRGRTSRCPPPARRAGARRFGRRCSPTCSRTPRRADRNSRRDARPGVAASGEGPETGAGAAGGAQSLDRRRSPGRADVAAERPAGRLFAASSSLTRAITSCGSNGFASTPSQPAAAALRLIHRLERACQQQDRNVRQPRRLLDVLRHLVAGLAGHADVHQHDIRRDPPRCAQSPGRRR